MNWALKICLFKTCWVSNMTYIFVEGPDDERFVSRILAPIIGEHQIIQYASMPNAKVNNFIRTINQMSSYDYIFLGDADGKSINERKTQLLAKYIALSCEKVFIVQYEIESWYYAGVSEEACRKLRLKNFVFTTDNLTKEQFYSKLSRPSDKKYILGCLLDVYSLLLAKSRNQSFGILAENIE